MTDDRDDNVTVPGHRLNSGDHSAETKASGRESKAHVGAYLDPGFRRSLRMVQAQTDKDIQELLAEALNDLFRKYNVTTVSRKD
jgi:hypothetical protein